MGRIKQTSDVSSNLWFQMGRVRAQEWYHQHKIFHPTVFDLVDLPSLDVTLSYKPQMYQIWLSKQASNFCATGKQLQRIDNRVTSTCPNCHMPDECACHLNICPDEGRSQLFHDNVASLHEWMQQPHTHPAIAQFTPRYISGRGTWIFCKFDNLSFDMRDLARCQDAIRSSWEGRLKTLPQTPTSPPPHRQHPRHSTGMDPYVHLQTPRHHTFTMDLLKLYQTPLHTWDTTPQSPRGHPA